MSQSLETTKPESNYPFWLGYPTEGWNNLYYTARVAPGLGVTVAKLLNSWMIQFFPWGEDTPGMSGHEVYVRFITQKARNIVDEVGSDLFRRYPHRISEDDNVMMLKCIIEDCIKQIGELDADSKRS